MKNLAPEPVKVDFRGTDPVIAFYPEQMSPKTLMVAGVQQTDPRLRPNGASIDDVLPPRDLLSMPMYMRRMANFADSLRGYEPVEDSKPEADAAAASTAPDVVKSE